MTDLKRTEQPDLTWDEAMGFAARLRGDKRLAPSLWPTKAQPRRVRFLRWFWEITDQTTDEVLARGHKLTERWAWHAADAAAARIHRERLDRIHPEADHG